MLGGNLEERAIEEFQSKLEAEIQGLGGAIERQKRDRMQMVKTANNRGARGVNMLDLEFSLNPSSTAELKNFLSLAQGVVSNHMLINQQRDQLTERQQGIKTA